MSGGSFYKRSRFQFTGVGRARIVRRAGAVCPHIFFYYSSYISLLFRHYVIHIIIIPYPNHLYTVIISRHYYLSIIFLPHIYLHHTSCLLYHYYISIIFLSSLYFCSISCLFSVYFHIVKHQNTLHDTDHDSENESCSGMARGGSSCVGPAIDARWPGAPAPNSHFAQKSDLKKFPYNTSQ